MAIMRTRLFALLTLAALATAASCSKTPPTPPPTGPASASAAALAPASSAPSIAAVKPPSSVPPCPDDKKSDITVFASPETPWTGAPLRVLVVSEKPMDGKLVLRGTDGVEVSSSDERRGGPPYWWFTEIAAPSAGAYHAELVNACARDVAKEIAIGEKAPANPKPTWGSVWPVHDEWNTRTENLYSAWIEKLFDAPLDQQPTWAALHEVLRDESRNFLFDHLGAAEDEQNFIIRPDCADLPYFLRAYFAFKIGLPFGYSECSRGAGGIPPACSKWWNNQDPTAAKRPGMVASFAHFVRWTLADAVHSGSGRAPAKDDNTDYYPVALDVESLRPGTIYADPYGHVLVLAKRIAQTPEAGGLFLAVDGQPDGTVARKRFWRGNFLFALDPLLGSPGFKRFRPVVKGKGGALRQMTNAEILASPDYGDYSLEQYGAGVEGFYDKMDDVMSPEPLDPVRAMKETIGALEEQVKTRVQSVDNGRKFLKTGRTAEMPDGSTIFETMGDWEDFSTPSRDLRLLIAVDVVRGFPDRVARLPGRYAMPVGKSIADVKAELVKTLDSELHARTFTYKRSDDSDFTLTLQDVIDRMDAFEAAYDPNDCVELRWGAPEGSDERSTCKRRAPFAQTARMQQYRNWFHTRTRPPRK